MICQDNHRTTTVRPKISHSTGSFAKGTDDWVFLDRYNAVFSDDEDGFNESERIQIIMGSDSSLIAALV